jgi:DNA replication and repair protein RecF
MLKRALFENRDRDLRLKTSSTGPHRDDICVMVDGIDIRKYGSQGQQRTAALSLKLSEIYLVRQRIHDEPVLLLDDVLSELDSGRQNYLLNSIHDIQTIITCTGLDDFIDHQFKINKVFHVVKGTVRGL